MERCIYRRVPSLPRYRPLISAKFHQAKGRRFETLHPLSRAREHILYIEGAPTRAINSCHYLNYPKRSYVTYVCPTTVNYHLTRATRYRASNDVSSSHLYALKGSTGDPTYRQEVTFRTGSCQEHIQETGLSLDMTPSESGVSVGESRDGSIFSDDTVSQSSVDSSSAFCELIFDNEWDKLDSEWDNWDSDSYSGLDCRCEEKISGEFDKRSWMSQPTARPLERSDLTFSNSLHREDDVFSSLSYKSRDILYTPRVSKTDGQASSISSSDLDNHPDCTLVSPAVLPFQPASRKDKRQTILYNSTVVENITNVGNLNTCVGDLDSCVGDLNSCVGDLDSCVGDLDNCVGDLDNCVGNLDNCVGDLDNCVGDLNSCVGDLDNCLRDLDNCEGDLDSSIGGAESTAKEHLFDVAILDVECSRSTRLEDFNCSNIILCDKDLSTGIISSTDQSNNKLGKKHGDKPANAGTGTNLSPWTITQKSENAELIQQLSDTLAESVEICVLPKVSSYFCEEVTEPQIANELDRNSSRQGTKQRLESEGTISHFLTNQTWACETSGTNNTNINMMADIHHHDYNNRGKMEVTNKLINSNDTSIQVNPTFKFNADLDGRILPEDKPNSSKVTDASLCRYLHESENGHLTQEPPGTLNCDCLLVKCQLDLGELTECAQVKDSNCDILAVQCGTSRRGGSHSWVIHQQVRGELAVKSSEFCDGKLLGVFVSDAIRLNNEEQKEQRQQQRKQQLYQYQKQQQPPGQQSPGHDDYELDDRPARGEGKRGNNFIDPSLAECGDWQGHSESWGASESGMCETFLTSKIIEVNKKSKICSTQHPTGHSPQLTLSLTTPFEFRETSQNIHVRGSANLPTKSSLHTSSSDNIFPDPLITNLRSLDNSSRVCPKQNHVDLCSEIPRTISDESIKSPGDTQPRPVSGSDKGMRSVNVFCVDFEETGELTRCSGLEGQQAVIPVSDHTQGNHCSGDDSFLSTPREDIDWHSGYTSAVGSFEAGPVYGTIVLSSSSSLIHTDLPTKDVYKYIAGTTDSDFSNVVIQDIVSIEDRVSSCDCSSSSSCLTAAPTVVSIHSLKKGSYRSLPSAEIKNITPLTSPWLSTCETDTGNCRMKERTNANNLFDVVSDLAVKDQVYPSIIKGSSFITSATRKSWKGMCASSPLDDLKTQLSVISGDDISTRPTFNNMASSIRYHDQATATTPLKPIIHDNICDKTINQPVTNLTSGNSSSACSQTGSCHEPSASNSQDSDSTKEQYDNDYDYVTSDSRKSLKMPSRPHHQLHLHKRSQQWASSLDTLQEEPESSPKEIPPTVSSNQEKLLPKTDSNTNPTNSSSLVPHETKTMSKLTCPDSKNDTEHVRPHNSSCGQKAVTHDLSRSDKASEGYSLFMPTQNCCTWSCSLGQNTLAINDPVSIPENIISDSGDKKAIEKHKLAGNGDKRTTSCPKSVRWLDSHISTSNWKNSSDFCETNTKVCPDHTQTHQREQKTPSFGSCNFSSGISDRNSKGEEIADGLSILDQLSRSLAQFNTPINSEVIEESFPCVTQAKATANSVTQPRDECLRACTSQECSTSTSEVLTLHNLEHPQQHKMSCDRQESCVGSDSSLYSCVGLAEFKDITFPDYDNTTDTMKINFNPNFTKITSVESNKDEQKISQFDLSTQEINVTTCKSENDKTDKCDNDTECSLHDLYQTFTNIETEVKQNHACIVVEDGNLNEFRFKRFLNKSHNKKGSKVFRFFSKLGCVSENISSPNESPKKLSKSSGKRGKKSKPSLKDTISEPVLISSTSFHHHDVLNSNFHASLDDISPPSTSSQSLDSTIDSAYSSNSESTDRSLSSPDDNSMSSSQFCVSSATSSSAITTSCAGSTFGSSADSTESLLRGSARSLPGSSDMSVLRFSSTTIEDVPRARSGQHNKIDALSDIVKQLEVYQNEVDSVLLDQLMYGHRPAHDRK